MCLGHGASAFRPRRKSTSERMAHPTTIGEQMPSARDVIRKHIDAVNGQDSDADPWAADAEITAPGAQVSGRDNVIGFLAVFLEAFPSIRLEIEQLLTDGPAAAAEGALTGTHNGVLHTPNGDVAPTGRAVELRWAALYVTDGDTLKSEHLFFDQMDFLGQLASSPARAGEPSPRLGRADAIRRLKVEILGCTSVLSPESPRR